MLIGMITMVGTALETAASFPRERGRTTRISLEMLGNVQEAATSANYGQLLQSILGPEAMMSADHSSTAAMILDIITATRRYPSGMACAVTPCPKCAGVHGGIIRDMVALGEPVSFVLPAFPGKSPNLRKVLGPKPDKAEEVALEFLDGMCRRISAHYSPGAVITICSDGRVFSDVVGIREEDITEYQRIMHVLAGRIGPDTLRLYHLDEAYPGLDHDAMRAALIAAYGEDLADIRARVAGGGAPLALYRGVTRFLFEDSDVPDHDRKPSRSARQRDSRHRAYSVIQRSVAWCELLKKNFPHAVRLSIHPHPCGSDRIGIGLVNSDDNWLTPWHGVAVEKGGRFTLMKRHEAELLDTELVNHDGRPSHYRLIDARRLAS